MPGARCTRSLACESCREHTSIVTVGSPDRPGIPARNGFNGFLRDLLGDRAFLSPSPAVCLRKLDASVEASGPHDFAVRLGVVRQRHLRVHRIPPRVRDDRDTPLWWDETARTTVVICVARKLKYFSKWGWTGKSLICHLSPERRMRARLTRLVQSVARKHARLQARHSLGGDVAEQQAGAEQQNQSGRSEFHSAHDQGAAALASGTEALRQVFRGDRDHGDGGDRDRGAQSHEEGGGYAGPEQSLRQREHQNQYRTRTGSDADREDRAQSATPAAG